MWTKRIKPIHVAIGAALLSSMFAVSANADWVSEQLAISDGTSMGGPAVSGQEARGPEGKPAVARESKRDTFLEQQLSLTDGAPLGAPEGAGPKGPEGRQAKPMGGGTDPFFEHQRGITDGL